MAREPEVASGMKLNMAEPERRVADRPHRHTYLMWIAAIAISLAGVTIALEAALKREILEELGVRICIDHHLQPPAFNPETIWHLCKSGFNDSN